MYFVKRIIYSSSEIKLITSNFLQLGVISFLISRMKIKNASIINHQIRILLNLLEIIGIFSK